MGWGSAGISIFDPVAREFIDVGVPEDRQERVLGDLIEALQREDWDTEQDSLDRFLDHPGIVRAFARHGITPPSADHREENHRA